MADSTTILDLISTSQRSPAVTANELFDAASPAMLYGRHASATAGLTWGWYGGALSVSGIPTFIANGTLSLTASATNYIEADATTGVVSANTTSFSGGTYPLYIVVAGTATVTSYTDQRTNGMGGGGGGGGGSPTGFAGGDLAGSTYPNPTIASHAITNAKLAQMAAHTFKGNNTGSTANASDLTASQLTAELDVFVGDTGASPGSVKGLVPAPAVGDALKVLSGAGTWVDQTGGGGGSTPTGSAGGDLTGTYPNPTLAATAVTAATYGDSTHIATFTVDSKGRLTAASNVSIPSATGTAGGDLTGTYPNPTIATGVVSNAKLATMAAHRFKGNNSASPGVPLDLTASQLTAELDVFVGDSGASPGSAKGLVPAPAVGDHDRVLSGGGSWVDQGSGGPPSGTAGGDLAGSTYPNPTLTTTGVTAATYGSATQVARVTVDAKGRLTLATNVTITGTTPGGSAGGDLTGSYPNPTLPTTAVSSGSYGDSTHIPTFTVDSKGRLTAAASVLYTGGATGSAGGDLTGTYPNPTIDTNTVTNAKLARMGPHTFKGNNTGIPADALDLTVAQLTAELDVFVGDSGSSPGSLKGLVPAPGVGDATKVLSGAGTWVAQSGGSSGTAGGDLTGTYPNPTLATTAVTPGSYGDATHVATFTVDAKGRLTAAGSTLITGITGPTGPTGPRAVPRQHTYTYASTLNIDASLYDVIDVTLTGNMTITFSGGTDGQTIRVRLKQDATGSRVLTLGAGIAASTDIIVPALSTGGNLTDRLAFEYSAARSSYDLVSFARGY